MNTDRLRSGLSRMDSAIADLDKLDYTFAQEVDPGTMEDMIQGTFRRFARNQIRQMLLDNFDASPIYKKSNPRYKRTGKLRNAVRNSSISLIYGENKNKWRIKIAMPPDVEPYKNQSDGQKGGRNKATGFYQAAGALNYGSVRVPTVERDMVDLPTGTARFKANYAPMLGQKARKTVKANALGYQVSAKAMGSLAKGVTMKRTGKTKAIRGGVKLDKWLDRGGVVTAKVKKSQDPITRNPRTGFIEYPSFSVIVTKPMPFFYLTEEQKAQIFDSMMARLQFLLNEYIGRKAG